MLVSPAWNNVKAILLKSRQAMNWPGTGETTYKNTAKFYQVLKLIFCLKC
jgi:hypothetical protein